MKSSKLNALIAASLLVALSVGCGGFKRPWRDYSKRPFNAAEWRAGDKIERGRMSLDFQAMRRELQGKDPNGIREMLGEPDLKKTIEGLEVWFYRVDIGIAGGMDLIPVSFDKKGRSMYGMVRGSTFSAMAKEEDL